MDFYMQARLCLGVSTGLRPAHHTHTSTVPGLLLATLLLLPATVAQAITFNEVGQAKGLTHTGTTYGAAWSKDANGDGKPDLWLGNHSTGADPILYLSTANGFSESTALTGLVSSDFHGSAWVDFNNDGHQDLLVLAGGGAGIGAERNQLFVGDGSQWTEQGEALGIDYPAGRARQATWLDWNSDGFLDVALINKNDRTTPPEADSRIFTWHPASQMFVEESFTIHTQVNQSFAQLSISNPSLGAGTPALVTWGRGNNAGPDIALSFDNSGFTNVDAALSLPAYSFVNDAIPGDFNNDGAQDLFALAGSNEILLLQGSNGYADASNGSGIATNQGAFVVAADFDNDMHLDLYIVRSDLANDTNKSNVLYRNLGNGSFAAVSNAGGAGGTLQGLASSGSAVDYNNDGRMDIFTTNSDNWFAPASATEGAPMQLFQNTTNNGNGWLKIILQGTVSNRDGIGATVVVSAGGVSQLREMNGGIHHRTQDDPRLHFGLASNTQADSVTVTWPSGIVQQLSNVGANQILTVVEQTSGNVPPTARFVTTSGSTALELQFDARTSTDADGSVTLWEWDFGDGTSASGEQVTHQFPQSGTYSVSLTVTDNAQASHTLTSNVLVDDATGGGLAPIAVSVADVATRASLEDRLIDQLTDNSQNLTTYWRNDNTLASAWVTLDLGSAASVGEVRIATRAKKAHQLEITIGNALANGEVSGGVVNLCSKPVTGTSVIPEQLHTCVLDAPATGRYVTVRSTNRASTRIYGIEIWASGGAGGGNASPTAAFTATSTLLQAGFDASSSSDSDGNITDWAWTFGDGNTDTGELTDHTYSASGTYIVTLTVTDDEGATNTVTQDITVSDGSEPQKLPVTIAHISARASVGNKAIDETASGEQNLSSRWSNSGGSPDSWITLDFGNSRTANELRIAPRGDRNHTYSVIVGDTLSGGRVNGSTQTCSIPINSGSSVPTVLTSCALDGTSGRYITVESTGDPYQRVYGIEVYQ